MVLKSDSFRSFPVNTKMINIREAEASDVAQIVQLLWDDEQGRDRESVSTKDAAIYRSAFDQITSDPNSLLLVAILEDELVGCLQLTSIPGLSYRGVRRALVEDVRIAQSHRGEGFGGSLLAYAESRAVELGCGLIELFVHDDRFDAHRFYQRAGYTGTHRGFRKALG